MREERGQITGDVVVYENFTLWGTIAGNVKVIKDGKFYIRGAIYGDLLLEPGGRVHLFGRITGNLTVMEDTKIIIDGVVGGNVINKGGRVYIERSATIMGKIKTTHEGKTIIHPKFQGVS